MRSWCFKDPYLDSSCPVSSWKSWRTKPPRLKTVNCSKHKQLFGWRILDAAEADFAEPLLWGCSHADHVYQHNAQQALYREVLDLRRGPVRPWTNWRDTVKSWQKHLETLGPILEDAEAAALAALSRSVCDPTRPRGSGMNQGQALKFKQKKWDKWKMNLYIE